MAGRRKRVEHDNHERWLISYADFVTLLFAFFVVMYSISSVNEGKYKTFSASLNTAFSQQTGTMVAGKPVVMTVVVDKQAALLLEKQKKLQEQMKQLEDRLHSAMAPLVEQGLVGIHKSRRGVVVDISASTLFREGDVGLQPGAQSTLQQIAQVLSEGKQSAEIEGHTDDVPIKTAQFPSNWELSAGRASSVVRMLVSYGVPEEHLAAVGMAANQPIVANDTPEHRARNRRVSITVLSPEFDRGNQQGELDKPAVDAPELPIAQSGVQISTPPAKSEKSLPPSPIKPEN